MNVVDDGLMERSLGPDPVAFNREVPGKLPTVADGGGVPSSKLYLASTPYTIFLIAQPFQN